MGAKSTSRSQQYLTRSGSFSTRLSPRGHGFEFSHWEDDEGAPVLTVNGNPLTETADDLTVARTTAGAYRDDVRWFKLGLHGVYRLLRLGLPRDAQMLSNILYSIPNVAHPARQSDLIETRLFNEMRDKARAHGWEPSPEFKVVAAAIARGEQIPATILGRSVAR